MGATNFSSSYYEKRQEDLKSKGHTAFQFTDSGAAAQLGTVHERLDPRKFKNGMREARDSDVHPESLPIIVAFDVTGSMHNTPRKIQAKLPTLMGLLTTKGYVKDPAIMYAAIGDAAPAYYSNDPATADHAPLQVGQFESGNEMDDDLSHMWLEGGGGGQKHESYALACYCFARHTVTDAWEKRQKKGYLFLAGDEIIRDSIPAAHIQKHIGDAVETDYSTEQIMNELKERYHVYFLDIEEGSYNHDSDKKKEWAKYVGENYIYVSDVDNIAELIASIIGINEGTASMVDAINNIRDLSSEDAAKSVEHDIVPYVEKRGELVGASASVVPTTGQSSSARL